MNLYYDNIVYALQRYGGISTYWFELTKRFLNDPETKLHFFETGYEADNILRQELELPEKTVSIYKRGGLLLERFRRLPLLTSLSDGIFHSSYFRLPQQGSRIKKVCTVHDFIHDRYYSKTRVFLHNFSKSRAIRESDVVITVSNHTKTDLLKYYPTTDPDKVIPIYNGVSHDFFPVKKSGRRQQVSYCLYIGVRDAYKNFRYCVELMAECKDYQLWIVGKPLNKAEATFLEKKLKTRYRFFTGVPIEQLNHLYNEAFCLLYPSGYEGFGIPLAEAMQAGCPFVALNASSIPEVAGNAGVLLDELTIDAGLTALELIRVNYSSIRQKGFTQVQQFSWDKCFEETRAVYKSLM